MPSWAAAQEAAATPFWLVPKVELELRALAPAAVQLVTTPDRSRAFALLQVGDYDPRNFAKDIAGNPSVANVDAGYRVVPGGLKVGALPYGDRTYKIEKLPEALAGLTLLQTRMGDKPVLDGRYALLLATAKPCSVFVAVDERALQIYKQHGVPSWLQEFAPTGHQLTTDDPVMAMTNAGYQVFVKKVPAGRIVLGPPCMDVNTNAMYFAFFADAK
jgi:hypothetical protein